MIWYYVEWARERTRPEKWIKKSYKRGEKNNIHNVVVASTPRARYNMIYIRGKGAEPDVIDRRRGPARQLAGHARPGARCYRLYYIIPTSPSSSLSSASRRRTTDDERRRRRRRDEERQRSGRRATKKSWKTREQRRRRMCTGLDVYSRLDEIRDKHTNSGQNITHTQPWRSGEQNKTSLLLHTTAAAAEVVAAAAK